MVPQAHAPIGRQAPKFPPHELVQHHGWWVFPACTAATQPAHSSKSKAGWYLCTENDEGSSLACACAVCMSACFCTSSSLWLLCLGFGVGVGVILFDESGRFWNWRYTHHGTMWAVPDVVSGSATLVPVVCVCVCVCVCLCLCVYVSYT